MNDQEGPSRRSMASLNGLPPELKAQIVKELALILLEEIGRDVDPFLERLEQDYGFDALAGPNSVQNQQFYERLQQFKTPIPTKEKETEKTAEDDEWEDEESEPEEDDDENDEYSGLRKAPTAEEWQDLQGKMKDLADSPFASLHNLSLVNREFAELSFPWIWQEIDLEDKSARLIVHLIKDILPRHARHVRTLAFGQSEPSLHDWTPEGMPRLGLAEATVIEAEKLYGPVAKVPHETRRRRARSLLIAKIIQMCPGIETLDCESFQKHPIPDDAYEDDDPIINEPEIYLIDHALDAVRFNAGPKLVDLSLLVNDDSFTTEGDVAKLIAACPNLLRLDLEIYCTYNKPEERKALHEALLKLRKLETLDVGAGEFINDEFVQLALAPIHHKNEEEEETSSNPFPALNCLALGYCQDLSFDSFFNFIHLFSSTLRVLDLDSTPHANHPAVTKKYLGRPFDLPHLRTLVISTPHEPKILDSFVNTKLTEFSYGFCPAFSYKNVEDFIALHQDTLKKVEIHDQAALTQAQVERLEVFCHAKGIECELLEPDSSDEEEDDEAYLDPSDFEDEDEGGWYDAGTDEEEEEEDEDEDEDEV